MAFRRGFNFTRRVLRFAGCGKRVCHGSIDLSNMDWVVRLQRFTTWNGYVGYGRTALS
ncbi:unnamed protein product [Cyberlindnera jadinii]|uniref:Uncharacterized protein n=1 Tax=Cyberlindnera jadinii (strain ATCC 18201 / CBS 1600 / BCRC 20928 / JCM 3617 / NBRC 0987 / NRRL Y-1542) TaxID=983966 RepID=A0A0H5C0S6_CYBJN|nr:unnamed protein product [Cyberlindnera jadinii]